MNAEAQSATCRFVFTDKEFRRAIALRTRTTPSRQYWIMFGCIALLLMVIVPQIYTDYHTTISRKPLENPWVNIFFDYLPLIIIFGFIGSLFSPFGGYFYQLFFRGQLSRNKELVYHIAENGINFKTAFSEGNLNWSAISRARENKEGFLLLTGRAIQWFPKTGFPSESEVEVCRRILRNHVRDFRQVGIR